MKFLGSKTLETKRLLLHKTEEKDLKELWEILLLEEVNRYYLVCKINDDWEIEKKFQYKKLDRAANLDVFQWTIELKDTHDVIGQISVQENSNYSQKDIRDIGWFLDPKYQKQGYAYEAALEVLKYMFLEVGIEKIVTCSAIVNPNSWRLMEKLGFQRLKSTHFEKYTFVEDEVEVYEYECSKNDFLHEYFYREKLYITESIDKEPYQKHISDDFILNITGESDSGKSFMTRDFLEDDNCIVIDTDLLNKKNSDNSYIEELRNYLITKYQEIPSLFTDFDKVYSSILDLFMDRGKMIVIDSAQFRNIRDIHLLKGDIVVLRTCIDTCYNRCIDRFQKNHPNCSLEELSSYSMKKKNMYKWYHSLNQFMVKIDKYL